MNKYIDADTLEKDGWNMQRIRQVSPTEMVCETKKPTDFPAADVQEMRHGRWVNDNGLYKCSACNTFTITGWANCIPIAQMNKTMRYCNNCGARMDIEYE